MKVVIVDDERPAREIIRAYLKNYDDIEVAGECANGFEGIKMIQDIKPDLVILDIQMPKLTGFEMLELLDQPPAVIFSTAYDNFALKAFEKNALDYLLKPFSAKRFDEAIQKARVRIKNNPLNRADFKQINKDYSEQLDRIAIRNGTNIIIIPVDQIQHIEAEDDYVAIISKGKKFLKQYTMRHLEESLPKDRFIRVHRSHIVKIDEINKLEAVTKDSYLAVLKDGTKIPVSRNGYNSLKEILNI